MDRGLENITENLDVNPSELNSETKRPASRAVLQNDELVNNIFESFLGWDTDVPGYAVELWLGRKQLRDLALCCKAFKEPALNRLWSTQYGLIPLFNTLPGFDIADHSFYRLNLNLSNDSPLIQYARRIRILYLSTPTRAPLSPHLPVLLAQSLKGCSLLPRLQKFFIRNTSTETFADLHPILPLILGPSIKQIQINNSILPSSYFREYCGPLIAERVPSLQDLRLISPSGVLSTGDTLFATAQQFKGLERLVLRDTRYATIQPALVIESIKSFNRLRSIVLDFHWDKHAPKTTGTQFSSSASELGIDLEHIESVQLIFKRQPHRCGCYPTFLLEAMTELVIEDWDDGTEPDVEKLAKWIPSPSRLNVVKLTAHPDFQLEARILNPLLRKYTSLQRLEILQGDLRFLSGSMTALLSCGPKPSNQEIATSLTTLVLPPQRSAQHHQVGIGLDDLILLVDSLVGLKSLSCTLRLGSRDTAEVLADLRRRHLGQSPDGRKARTSMLRTLYISDPRPSKAGFSIPIYDNIGEILDLLFTHLIEMGPYRESERGQRYWTECWAHVDRFRQLHQTIRRSRNVKWS